MRKLLPAVIALGVVAPVAHAQETPQYLSWEHSLTTRTSDSKHPLARVKIFNNWTDNKHRILVKYNVSGLGARRDFFGGGYNAPFPMPDFNSKRIAKKLAYHNGSLGIVQDLTANKLIAYSSDAGKKGAYLNEDRQALIKRLRFDPWKKTAPELSREKAPNLTPAQRARLGREVYASLRPMLKNVIRTYFRALPQRRTFTVGGEKLEARGYRMTVMMNAGGYFSDEDWVRTSFEWWLAPEVPGDKVARQFMGKQITEYVALGGPTTSMWMNETLPIMWASMPPEFHQALSTLLPQAFNGVLVSEGNALPLIGGTPVYMASTVLQTTTEYTYKRCPSCGENHIPVAGKPKKNTIRLELRLNSRNTERLADTVFEAPKDYEKESVEPILESWEEGLEMMQGIYGGGYGYDEEEIEVDAEEVSALHQKATLKPRYTWRAFNDYRKKAVELLRLGAANAGELQ